MSRRAGTTASNTGFPTPSKNQVLYVSYNSQKNALRCPGDFVDWTLPCRSGEESKGASIECWRPTFLYDPVRVYCIWSPKWRSTNFLTNRHGSHSALHMADLITELNGLSSTPRSGKPELIKVRVNRFLRRNEHLLVPTILPRQSRRPFEPLHCNDFHAIWALLRFHGRESS